MLGVVPPHFIEEKLRGIIVKKDSRLHSEGHRQELLLSKHVDIVLEIGSTLVAGLLFGP